MHHHVLECDCNGQEYTNITHGITLRIPEGAITKGKIVHFEVGITMYGPFIFPENTRPISPILWLCLLEEDTELNKPFQIVIPHYLVGNFHHYHVEFAKAHHNNYIVNSNSQLFYTFYGLAKDPKLTSEQGQNYGILETDHFCYLCLKAEVKPEINRDLSYCLVRVESCPSDLRHEIFFCALYCLPTCLEVL